jgi:hypothetical protein
VTVAGLVVLACLFVLLAVLGFEEAAGISAAMAPALLPILIGAMLFGYAVGIGLLLFTTALLLAVSLFIADPPSLLALQTVLVVCSVATLVVGCHDQRPRPADLSASMPRWPSGPVSSMPGTSAHQGQCRAREGGRTDQLPASPIAAPSSRASPNGWPCRRRRSASLIDIDHFKRIQ